MEWQPAPARSSFPPPIAQDCFWPLAVEDERVCTMDAGGTHTCGVGSWCGSNYDAFGNERFLDGGVMQAATAIPSRFYGVFSFDNIARAVLSVFQCITMEVRTVARRPLRSFFGCRCGPFCVAAACSVDACLFC